MTAEIEDLFALYALGALSDEERAEVEEYVATRPAAAQRLQEMLATTAELPYAAAPLPLSDEIKRSIMARIRGAGRPARESEPGRPGLRALWDRPAGLRAAAVVSLALAAIALFWGLSNGRRLAESRTALATLQSQIGELQAQRQNQSAALELLADARSRVYRVPATEAGQAASALFVVGPAGEQMALIAADLPQLDEAFVYQLWLIVGEAPVSAGLLTVDTDGTASHLVSTTDLGSTEFDAIGVSVEPAGGSAAPTGEIVLLGAQLISDSESQSRVPRGRGI